MIKIKALCDNFLMPERKRNSAGYDLKLQEDVILNSKADNVIRLGFATEIPEGYCGLLMMRSSAGLNGIRLLNTVGVIDSDYRGEWIAHLDVETSGTVYREIAYKRGDRILQAVFVPVLQTELSLVTELSETERGKGGFGSTGTGNS